MRHDQGTERSFIALTSTPIARSPTGPRYFICSTVAFAQLAGFAPGAWPVAATRHVILSEVLIFAEFISCGRGWVPPYPTICPTFDGRTDHPRSFACGSAGSIRSPVTARASAADGISMLDR